MNLLVSKHAVDFLLPANVSAVSDAVSTAHEKAKDVRQVLEEKLQQAGVSSSNSAFWDFFLCSLYSANTICLFLFILTTLLTLYKLMSIKMLKIVLKNVNNNKNINIIIKVLHGVNCNKQNSHMLTLDINRLY